MTRNSTKLRLGPLPRSETVKLTIAVSADLRQSLEDYATAHSQVHGESVDVTTLIPHMLQAFIARDRGFKTFTKRPPRSLPPAPPPS